MNIKTVAIAAPIEPYRDIRIISKIIFRVPLKIAIIRLNFTFPMLAIILPFGILNVQAIR